MRGYRIEYYQQTTDINTVKRKSRLLNKRREFLVGEKECWNIIEFILEQTAE